MYKTILPLAIAIGGLMSVSPAAAEQSKSSSSPTAQQPVSQPAEYSKAMRRLLEAAQRLRDATHVMAAQQPGPTRSKAIEQTNEALLETQRAMLELPLELRRLPDMAPDYTRAMDRLKQAAQKLRDATHAMANQPAGKDRNAAIKQTNEALLETQQAMVDLLSGERSATTGTNR